MIAARVASAPARAAAGALAFEALGADQMRQLFPETTSRVATLREAVAEGRYQPDGGAIADALIALESDLGGVRR